MNRKHDSINNVPITCFYECFYEKNLVVFKGLLSVLFVKINIYIGIFFNLISIKNFHLEEKIVKKFVDSEFVKTCDEKVTRLMYFWMIVKSYQLFNPFNHLLIHSTFGTLHLQNVLERAIWRGSTFFLKEISSTYMCTVGDVFNTFCKVISSRNITRSKLLLKFLHIFCGYSTQLLFLKVR